MSKLFLKNIALTQLLNIVIKPVWLLVIDRVAQNELRDEYSGYYTALNLALLFNILLDIGIQNFNQAQVASNSNFFKTNIKVFIRLKLILSAIYFLIVVSIGMVSKHSLGLLLLVSLNQILTSFVLYFRSNLSGLHLFTIDSVLSVSDKGIAIIVSIVFYFTNFKTIYAFIFAQTIGLVITLLISISYNLASYKKLKEITELPKNSLKQLIIKSLPFALLFALMGLYTRLDVAMMQWLLPDFLYHNGIYAQSFRLLDAATMFAMLFSGILLPMFSRLISESKSVVSLINLSGVILYVISITVVIVVWLMGDRLLTLLYDFNDVEDLNLSYRIFKNIMLCFVPMCFVYVFGTLLTAKADIKAMNIFAIVALLTNLVLNFILIPNNQSHGASISSVITQSVFGFLCLVRCFYLFKFKINFSLLGKLFVFTFCQIGLVFFVKSFDNLLISLFIIGMTSILFPFLLNIFTVDKLKEILQKDEQ